MKKKIKYMKNILIVYIFFIYHITCSIMPGDILVDDEIISDIKNSFVNE